MKYECPCDCNCIPCNCMKVDDYFYILCTNCMFSLLKYTRDLLEEDNFFSSLRKAFTWKYKAHAHKTLIVLPLHIMHESARKKSIKWANDIKSDIHINRLGVTGRTPDVWSWKHSKTRTKKNKIMSYSISPNGKIGKVNHKGN